MVLYVSKAMGDFFVQPPIISIDGVFDQSTPTRPVVFILSPGADPAGDLTKLADRSGTASSLFQTDLLYACIVDCTVRFVEQSIRAMCSSQLYTIYIQL